MHYKVLFLFSVIGCSFAAYYEEQYERLKVKFQQRSENNAESTWKFGLNPYFEGASEESLKRRLGVKKHKADTSTPTMSSARNSNDTLGLPREFDARKNWPHCKKVISYIKDQSNCGSCWAVSTASAISDRHCIANEGRSQIFLSEEELVSCCRVCGDGCEGGFPKMAFVYWATRGLPTGGPYGFKRSCKPYSIKPCVGCFNSAFTPTCQHQCVEGYDVKLSADRHFGTKAYSLPTEQDIMRDIYEHGPVVASFAVYQDFFYYTGGIYQHHSWAEPAGFHAVRIIGWGEGPKPYWLVANSWSEKFGEEGLFRILRGSNECSIEEDVVAARPRLPK